MNPFLHSTVAQPSSAPSFRRHPAHRRAHRVLYAAGLAALAWSTGVAAVDLNTATLEELMRIRGIGPRTAQILLDERTRGGRFESFTDLSDRVRGIGPRRAQALQAAGLTLEPRSGAPAGSASAAPARSSPK